MPVDTDRAEKTARLALSYRTHTQFDGQVIRLYRQSLGMNQAELGMAMGMQPISAAPGVSQIENNYRIPGPKILARLAKALGVEVDALFDREAAEKAAAESPYPQRRRTSLKSETMIAVLRANPGVIFTARELAEAAAEVDEGEGDRDYYTFLTGIKNFEDKFPEYSRRTRGHRYFCAEPSLVVVPSADTMDDDTLRQHFAMRHEVTLNERGPELDIESLRRTHKTDHRAFPGELEHTHK